MTTDYRAILLELVEAWESYSYADAGDATDRMSEAVKEARAALAQPEPVGPTDEELLRCMIEAADSVPGGQATGIIDWEREAIAAARAILARWGRPAITPIPVSERLPTDADCDNHGRCWAWNPESLWWDYWQPKFIRMNAGDPYTHWLPGWALPLPTT